MSIIVNVPIPKPDAVGNMPVGSVGGVGNLADCGDVELTSEAANDMLMYDGSKWVNHAVGTYWPTNYWPGSYWP